MKKSKMIGHLIKRCELWLLAFVLSFNLNAQNNSIEELQQEVIPPSPTASALIKFADIPVSYYTGRPQVNIPLIGVKSGGLSLNIDLSYHTGGVKVSEVPGWVGLGWALNAGGCISRNVRGLPDEIKANHPAASLGELYGNDAKYTKYGYWGIGKYVDDVILGSTFEKERQLLLYGAATNMLDLEPDIFSYNFNGKSGQFIIEVDESGNRHVRTIPLMELEIKETINSGDQITGFSIVDEVGTKYYFTKVERSYMQGVGSSSSGHNTSWMLTRIESASSEDFIEFQYKPDSEKYWSYGQTVYDKKGSSKEILSGANKKYEEKGLVSNNVLITNYTQKISKIITSNEEVVFSSDVGRKDLNREALILNDIQLFDKKSGQLKKHFHLSYSYFNSSPRASVSDTESYRLKLDQVQEVDVENSIPPHIFTYASGSLPRRNSFNQDYWGYYNGDSNDNWVAKDGKYSPSGYFVSSEADVIMGYGNDPRTLEGANRMPSSNVNVLSAGSLKSITYPTGGKVEFTYEPHDYYSESISQGYNKNTPVFQKYHGLNQTNVFSVTQSMSEKNIKLSFLTCPSVTKISLKKSNGAWVRDFTPILGMIAPWEGKLNAGDYYFTFLFDSSNEPCPQNTVSLSYQTQTYIPPRLVKENKIACGGVRIQKVENFTATGEVAKTMVYSYTKNENSGFSSGVLVDGIPINSYSVTEKASFPVSFNDPDGNHAIFGSYDYHVRSSSPLNSLTYTQGSPVGYKEVEVEYVGKLSGETNGKSRFLFSVFTSDSPQENMYPFVPALNLAYKQGKLIKEEHFDDKGANISTSDYNYNWISSSYKSININKVGMNSYTTNNQFYLDNLGTSEECEYINFNIANYSIQQDYVCLASKIDSVFNKNGCVVNVEEYAYYSPSLLKWKKNYNSDNKAYKVNYSYPTTVKNTSDETTITNKMVDRNMLAIPLKIEKVNNQTGELLEGRKDIYKEVTGNGQTYLVKDNVELFCNGTYAKELDYVMYSKFGRINKYITKDGLYVGFIWGYNQQFPVAKIISPQSYALNQVQLAVNLLSLYGDDDKGHVDQDLQKIKNAVESVCGSTNMASYYTYDPVCGMTGQTDPNGITTYYEYDDFGRLEYVKDDAGNILKKISYHYQNR
jgi:YD repeat-containing protein